ncbi:MAG: hypothetical protein KC493_06180 [Bacteriovoracaceae bacterium]|nr:hypothetical protein [Bacteriovoracaceae bacterium]
MLVLTSCSKNNSGLNTKVLNQVSSPLTHFDPQMTTGLASLIQLGKVYESLLETHPFNGPYEVLPSLAEELPSLSNGKTIYTFKIRKGVKYHPCKCIKGERFVRAMDFVTTFKRIADPHLSSPHFGYWKKQIKGLEEWYEQNRKLDKTNYDLPLEGVKVIDEYTLQITLKSANLYFVNDLTTPSTAPIPREALEYYKNDLSNNVVGTGPFVLDSYVRKSRIQYSRNKSYRKKLFPNTSNKRFEEYVKEYAGKEVPFLEKIVVHVINESQTQWLNFMKGKLDYLEVPKDNFSQAITPSKSLSPEMLSKNISLGITPSNSNVYYFGFNNKDKFLKNKHLRRAIAYAFDQYEYNRLFFNGTADIANTILPPGILGNNPPMKSKFIGPKIDKAKQELKLAGYPNGKGLPEIVLTVRSSTLARQIGEFFVKEMKKVGINARVEMVAWGKLLEKAQKGTYQIFYLAWFVGLPTGFQFFDLLYGPNWPGSYNRMGHTNKKFDELYRKALESTDLSIQEMSFMAMNRIALENVPLLPLVHAKDFFLRQGWLKNYVPAEATGGLEQYYDIDLHLKKKFLEKF